MNVTPSLPSHNTGAPDGPSFHDSFASARRYWERRRFTYNAVLTVLVIGWVVFTWPHFRSVFTFAYFLPALAYLLLLAALGNLCYCAAYPVDFALQRFFSPVFLRRARATLWWAGMIFAFTLAYYWIGDEIYPG
jgi:hypothetical protein